MATSDGSCVRVSRGALIVPPPLQAALYPTGPAVRGVLWVIQTCAAVVCNLHLAGSRVYQRPREKAVPHRRAAALLELVAGPPVGSRIDCYSCCFAPKMRAKHFAPSEIAGAACRWSNAVREDDGGGANDDASSVGDASSEYGDD